MYMNDIKLFEKNEKKIGDSNTNNKNIQSGYWNGILHRKMHQDNNEKLKKTNNRRNRTAKSRKNQIGDETNNNKRVSKTNKKTSKNQLSSRILIKGINTWAVSEPFLKWTREKLQID